MYQPVLAQFTALDPLPPDEDPVLLGASRFAYVNNNPINFVDPSGMSPISQFCCYVLCMGDIATDMQDRLRRTGVPDRDDAGGGNAFLHCTISCQIHSACPVCDNNWDNRENRGTVDGQQDLRNNRVGRTIGGSCWDGCLKLWEDGKLSCRAAGNRLRLVPCPPPPKDYADPGSIHEDGPPAGSY
ncbi:MAG: RHS repeat-associated core domain-containing protein [Planctomycetales bacterium]